MFAQVMATQRRVSVCKYFVHIYRPVQCRVREHSQYATLVKIRYPTCICRVLKNRDPSPLSKNRGFGVYSMNRTGGWLKLSVTIG
jgi:hypothetical protein